MMLVVLAACGFLLSLCTDSDATEAAEAVERPAPLVRTATCAGLAKSSRISPSRYYRIRRGMAFHDVIGLMGDRCDFVMKVKEGYAYTWLQDDGCNVMVTFDRPQGRVTHKVMHKSCTD